MDTLVDSYCSPKEQNIEYRIMNVEYRRKVFCLFNKKDRAQRYQPSKFGPPPAEIFCGSAVRLSCGFADLFLAMNRYHRNIIKLGGITNMVKYI